MVPVSARSCSRTRRSSFPRVVWLPLAALLVAASQLAYAQAARGLRVVPLVRDDRVLVSFELRDAFTPDMRAAIHSGLTTTFTYTVDLRLAPAGWFDRTIAQAVVANTVDFANLTRKYQLERRIDGRIEATHVSEDEAEVRQWLTAMERLPLFPTAMLERNREYYVRVNATARPSNAPMLWPFGSGISGQQKFTFIR